jgi:hypothetical protein
MNSFVRAGLVVAVLALSAQPASAQLGISFGATAGLAVPVGETADGVGSGFTVGGLMRVKPLLSPIGIRVDGGYTQLSGKDFSSGGVTVEGANFNIWHLTANAELSLLPTGLLYAVGGGGLFNGKGEGATESSTDFGFNVGAGVKIPLTGFGTFIEARYTQVQVEGGSYKYVPIVFGFSF